MKIKLMQLAGMLLLMTLFLQVSGGVLASASPVPQSGVSRKVYTFTLGKYVVYWIKKSYYNALSLANNIERYIVDREFACLAGYIRSIIVASAALIVANTLYNMAKNSRGSMTFTQVVDKSGVPAICFIGTVAEIWRNLSRIYRVLGL